MSFSLTNRKTRQGKAVEDEIRASLIHLSKKWDKFYWKRIYDAKTYYAEAFVIWSHDASNTDAFFEFRNFASNILSERITIEPQDSGGGGAGGTSQRIDLTMRGEVTPTAGSVQLDIFFGTSDNGDETTIYEAQIYLREKQ